MKINMPVTQHEVPYPKGMYVVSQTDLKGVIRDANEAFVALSGFTREELIGKSHNIVRHPDVPPAIFADMWASIKAGLPWQAVVKNRCKNGDHYWVDAQVVPIIKNGEISGYMSVRREASRQQISEAEALFAEVKRTGKFNSIRRKPTPLSVWLYGIASFSIVMFILNNALMFMGTPLWLEKTVGILGMLALLPLPFVLHTKVFAPLNEVRKNILRLTEGDLASRYPILKPNEIGQIANSFQIMQTQWLVSLDHIKDSIRDSLQGMQHVNEESDSINRQIESQHDRVSAVAAATEEFCQAIAEVASHAADTSRAAETSEGLIQTSQQTVKAGMQAAEVVVGAVSKSHTSIAELDQAVGKIGDITKVIKEIAEQTNLLALNAAIEAARAGETGRGFAVVADEVRKLAERTARSTQEINGMVSGIQNMASEVVASMDEAASAVESSSGKMRESVEGLNRVTEASRNTLEMAEHIATASDQQSIAGQEVANNMEQISQLSEQNQDKLRSLKQSLEEMRVATNRIDEAVGVFKLFSR